MKRKRSVPVRISTPAESSSSSKRRLNVSLASRGSIAASPSASPIAGGSSSPTLSSTSSSAVRKFAANVPRASTTSFAPFPPSVQRAADAVFRFPDDESPRASLPSARRLPVRRASLGIRDRVMVRLSQADVDELAAEFGDDAASRLPAGILVKGIVILQCRIETDRDGGKDDPAPTAATNGSTHAGTKGSKKGGGRASHVRSRDDVALSASVPDDDASYVVLTSVGLAVLRSRSSLLLSDASPPPSALLIDSQRVFARAADGFFYPGTVSASTASSHYSVSFDDGDPRPPVRRSDIVVDGQAGVGPHALQVCQRVGILWTTHAAADKGEKDDKDDFSINSDDAIDDVTTYVTACDDYLAYAGCGDGLCGRDVADALCRRLRHAAFPDEALHGGIVIERIAREAGEGGACADYYVVRLDAGGFRVVHASNVRLATGVFATHYD